MAILALGVSVTSAVIFTQDIATYLDSKNNVGVTKDSAQQNTLSTNEVVDDLTQTNSQSIFQGNQSNQSSQNISSTDFIVTPYGDTLIVPEGSTGPFPTNNGKGFQYQGGEGGKGLSNSVSGLRIMEPTGPNPPSPGYPNGYGVYNNTSGQKINPYTGQTIPNSDEWAHFPFGR